MPDDTPTTPPDDGSGHVDRWVTDTWEGHLHVVLLILESVALSFMIICAFQDLIPEAIGGGGSVGQPDPSSSQPSAATAGANIGESALTLLQLVAWGGALGGFLHMITSFVGALDEGPLYRSRFLRLAFRPVVGAGLAVVVYFVLQTGLLSPVSSIPSGAAGAGTVANNATDVYRTLAIACLTGLFARRAMDKLREVFFMLFQPKNQAGQGGQGPKAS